ncbi:hypothetical protein HDU84_008396 [Entophlyctis sp. JEL0112]|nr:hypothetical protein HDU84_008396 [Entophlyctis sp. JEL0112]
MDSGDSNYINNNNNDIINISRSSSNNNGSENNGISNININSSSNAATSAYASAPDHPLLPHPLAHLNPNPHSHSQLQRPGPFPPTPASGGDTHAISSGANAPQGTIQPPYGGQNTHPMNGVYPHYSNPPQPQPYYAPQPPAQPTSLPHNSFHPPQNGHRQYPQNPQAGAYHPYPYSGDHDAESRGPVAMLPLPFPNDYPNEYHHPPASAYYHPPYSAAGPRPPQPYPPLPQPWQSQQQHLPPHQQQPQHPPAQIQNTYYQRPPMPQPPPPQQTYAAYVPPAPAVAAPAPATVFTPVERRRGRPPASAKLLATAPPQQPVMTTPATSAATTTTTTAMAGTRRVNATIVLPPLLPSSSPTAPAAMSRAQSAAVAAAAAAAAMSEGANKRLKLENGGAAFVDTAQPPLPASAPGSVVVSVVVPTMPATVVDPAHPTRVRIGDDLDAAQLSVAVALHPLKPVVAPDALQLIPAAVVPAEDAAAPNGKSGAADDASTSSSGNNNGTPVQKQYFHKLVRTRKIRPQKPATRTRRQKESAAAAGASNDGDSEDEEEVMDNDDTGDWKLNAPPPKQIKKDRSCESIAVPVVETAIVGTTVVVDKKLLESQTRRLSLNESMDMLAVVDMLREFGSDLLDLDGYDDITLGSIETLLYNLPTNHMQLISIYSSFLLFIYPQFRSGPKLDPVDVPAHLSHHFACSLTASTSFGSFAIDARHLCRLFSETPFPDIPPPFHAAALTSLVVSMHAQRRFHEAVNKAVDDGEAARRLRNLQNVRLREIRQTVSALKADLATLDLSIVDLETRSEALQAMLDNETQENAYQMDPAQRASNQALLSEMKSRILQQRSDHSAKTAQVAQLLEEEQNVTEQSLKYRMDAEKQGSRVRFSSTRVLGYDRFGSMYLWIDLGSSDKQSFETPDVEVPGGNSSASGAENGASRKLARYRIGGILVDPTYARMLPNTAAAEDSSSGAINGAESKAMYKYIDSVGVLKQFAKTLNDRGVRERELIVTLREKFFEDGLAIPHPTSQGYRREWRALENAGMSHSEAVLDAGFQAFGRWVEALGRRLAEESADAEMASLSSRESLADAEKDDATEQQQQQQQQTEGRKTRRKSKVAAVKPPLPVAETAEKEFERLSISVAKDRLKELMPVIGTLGKHAAATSAATERRDRQHIEAIATLHEANEMACELVSRKFGKLTVAELEMRFERCATWSSFCVLLSDIMRENGSKRLNEWLEETRDGGWVEEDEDTTEIEDLQKGRGLQKKVVLTRKPRKPPPSRANGAGAGGETGGSSPPGPGVAGEVADGISGV